jgi:hypothetical protein
LKGDDCGFCEGSKLLPREIDYRDTTPILDQQVVGRGQPCDSRALRRSDDALALPTIPVTLARKFNFDAAPLLLGMVIAAIFELSGTPPFIASVATAPLSPVLMFNRCAPQLAAIAPTLSASCISMDQRCARAGDPRVPIERGCRGATHHSQ